MIDTILNFLQTDVGTFALGYIASTIVCQIGEYHRNKKIFAEIKELNAKIQLMMESE